MLGWTGDYNDAGTSSARSSRIIRRFGTQYYYWVSSCPMTCPPPTPSRDAATRTGMYEELEQENHG